MASPLSAPILRNHADFPHEGRRLYYDVAPIATLRSTVIWQWGGGCGCRQLVIYGSVIKGKICRGGLPVIPCLLPYVHTHAEFTHGPVYSPATIHLSAGLTSDSINSS